MRQTTLVLRAEDKLHERRTPLSPKGARLLISQGHKVLVESSERRVFPDETYAAAGCKIVAPGFWKIAPLSSYILGLKELAESSTALAHRHIYFAHAYKGQDGAEEILDRFIQGGGKLYDLEFLLDSNNNRVAAFGTWAGFAGAAMSVLAWIERQKENSLNIISPIGDFENQLELIDYLRAQLDHLEKTPRAMVIGYKGRCGQGAIKLFSLLGVPTKKWGSEQTKNRGPFKEILDYDILLNSVYLNSKIPPFLTTELLKEDKNLQVICDVTCAPNEPNNPLPVYQECTTFNAPCLQVQDIELIAIDNLPTLLPRESSYDFEDQLLPHLQQILNGEIEGTAWEKSLEYFFETTMNMGLEYIPNLKKMQGPPEHLM